MNQHTHPVQTEAAAKAINGDIKNTYLCMLGQTNYYLINGRIWGWWQQHTGTWPELCDRPVIEFLAFVIPYGKSEVEKIIVKALDYDMSRKVAEGKGIVQSVWPA